MIVVFIPAFIVALLGLFHVIPKNITEILMIIFGLVPVVIMILSQVVHPFVAAFKERKETGRFGSSLFVALVLASIACLAVVLGVLDSNH